MREDIYIWLAFLGNFNGITSNEIVDWLNDNDMELFIGRSGNANLGRGAVFCTH